MEMLQIEKLLDSLKGEESIFRLFKNGKYFELAELYKTFLSAEVHTPYQINETLNAVAQERKNALISITGEPGVGKSTLLSTLLVNNYLRGNLDQIHYLRYDPALKDFGEIFNISRGDGRGMKAVVIDDILYFLPELVSNVIVRGSVSQFDKFVGKMQYVNDLATRSGRSGSVVVYVSDTYGLRTLQKALGKILLAAERSDLASVLPTLARQNKPRRYETSVGTEFFAQTYALAGGGIEDYNAALFFGDQIKEDSGLFGTNARLMRYLIDQVRLHKGNTDARFFADQDLAKKIFRGESITSKDIDDDFQSRLGDSFEGLEDAVSGPIQLTYQNFSDLREESVKWQEAVSPLVRLAKGSGLSYAEVDQFAETLFRDEIRLKNPHLPSFPEGRIETAEDIAQRIEVAKTASKMVVEKISETRQKLESERKKLAESTIGNYVMRSLDVFVEQHNNLTHDPFNEIDRSLFYKVSPFFARKDVNSLDELVAARSKIIDVTQLFMDSVIKANETEARRLFDLLHFYQAVVENPSAIQSYQVAYKQIRQAAEEYAAKQPIIFSATTPERILARKFVNSPDEFISKMNPHTIDLIRNLEVIPYITQ